MANRTASPLMKAFTLPTQAAPLLSSIVDTALRAPGQPLDPATRAFMEPRFGHDFSRVRIHSDDYAAEAAQALNARACTVGQDIIFGGGQYTVENTTGQQLLAHELAHTLQQSGKTPVLSSKSTLSDPGHPSEVEAERAAAAVSSGQSFQVSQSVTDTVVSRARLDIGDIRQDIHEGLHTPVQLYSWLHVMGERSGEVGRSAAPAGQADLPIEAVFFPSFLNRHHDRRALVLGGFHGNEKPGVEIADALVTDLRSGTGTVARGLNYHTIVIPRVNPWGAAHNNRCNANNVDLNRNLPVPGASSSSPVCTNTATAGVQPETQAVVDVISSFQPNRILSMHSISNPAEAGIYADPDTDPTARRLACSMAGRIVNPANRLGNRITPTSCNPVYPGGATGARSLGAYAPSRSIPNQTVPVITLEAPRHASLAGPGRPAVSEFMPAVEEFLH